MTAYGNVTLNVNCSSLSITGGSGANALSVHGNLVINNEKDLQIKGGDGGCGIDCIDLTLNNTGVVSVVGGINGHAVYARNAAINEVGVTTFVGGAIKAVAVSNGNLVPNKELKSYSGDNAASTVRGMNLYSRYLRFEKKSILVNFNPNGGGWTQLQETSVTMEQNADNEIVLQFEEPEKFGYAFRGWQDQAGRTYETGETYAFSSTQDTLELQAIWEALDYDVQKTDDGVEIMIKDPVPAGSSVLLTSYSADGKMKKVAFGTFADGVWSFGSVPDGDWKLFFVDNDYAPTQTQLPIEQ